MRLRATVMAAIGLLATSHLAVRAQEPRAAVVELFTSQGCSSCPPADALFHTYASRKDLIALSMPVDYWDHLGWKDTLASASNSRRQRAYARTLGTGNVYTPQIVVDGVEQAIGSYGAKVERAILAARSRAPASRIAIAARLVNDVIKIDIGAGTGDDASAHATVWFAVVSPRVDVKIRRGENRGRTLSYFNVVRSMTRVGMYAGKQLTLSLPATAAEGRDQICAVMVQRGEAGRIVSAAWMKR